MDRKINKRGLIEGFNNFKSINEKIDPYKMDISNLTKTREGFDIFIGMVKDEGMSVRQPTTHGYEINAYDRHLDLLNHWRDKYGLVYEVDRVTNNEHPDYGKKFYKINLFRDPTKFTDISDWVKKINR